jgi:hypothetical protein
MRDAQPLQTAEQEHATINYKEIDDYGYTFSMIL